MSIICEVAVSLQHEDEMCAHSELDSAAVSHRTPFCVVSPVTKNRAVGPLGDDCCWHL